MKAWQVGCDGPYESEDVAVHAATRGQARLLGARELNISFMEVEYVRRLPALDGRPITPQALMALGWWFYCGGCSRRLYEDDDEPIHYDQAGYPHCQECCVEEEAAS